MGYNSYTNLKDSESYFLGATISPYKSYRWYWQVELMNNFHSYSEENILNEEIVEDQGFRFWQRTTTNSSFENIDWDIPVLLRYNVNNYIGLGAGVQNTFSVNEKIDQHTLVEQFEGTDADAPVFNTIENDSNQTNSFTNLRTSLLFEATAGFARIGPSLGARYIMDFDNHFNYWQFYAIWKF